MRHPPLSPYPPCLVRQRARHPATLFVDDDDRRQLLALLHSALLKHGLLLHAYVVMDDHLHLLATPRTGDGVLRALRACCAAYSRAFSQRHGRPAPQWQTGLQCLPVQEPAYLLGAHRHVERGPVHARVVEHPEQHAWSSIHGNLGLREDALLTPHPQYQALGADAPERALRYAAFLCDGTAHADAIAIEALARRPPALGAAVTLRAPRLSRK
ncbi:transposase [Stenotrophomonas sp.]|uniref:transposase n=1 Tax=Stenotrophomonas sp. TaxID=69392 RepID=UPI0031E45890